MPLNESVPFIILGEEKAMERVEKCPECGLILRLKVEKPHKFKRK
ncbi:MAG: hypothetical protein PHS69_07165 [Firmicutes bacterium]|nr:hypothetical protein [Bacillota bacterium]